MEIMVTSEITALMAIKSDARTGRPTRIKLLAASVGGSSLPPTIRPTTRKARTGITMAPNAPIGSRMKILISSQLSFQSQRSIILVPTREWSDQSVSEKRLQDWEESCGNQRLECGSPTDNECHRRQSHRHGLEW